MKMGSRLKMAREQANLSLYELAKAVNTSHTSIARWESGGVLPAWAILSIAKTTGRPIEYFLLDDYELSDTKIQSTAKVAANLGEIISQKDEEIDQLKEKTVEYQKVQKRFGHLAAGDDIVDVLDYLSSLPKEMRLKLEKKIHDYSRDIIAKAIGDEKRAKKKKEETKKSG